MLRGPDRPDLLREETLAAILTATARRLPHQTALVWGNFSVSYTELDSTSDDIGRALGRLGAVPGRVVGLLLPRGARLLMAQAGIAKSGAAWLPFDADAPIERISACLQAAQAVGLVTCRDWLARLQHLSVPMWAVEDLMCGAGDSSPLPRAQPADPAYVIYTSGSTGQPKGIVISNRSICHFIRAENELLQIRPDDRVYQGFSVAFDMSFEEIWISYLMGATLWLAPPALVNDPESLAQVLTRERISVMHAVPTLMNLLPEPLPTLRLINLGGEACPPSLAARLARPGRRVFNTYGPTETTVSASLAELQLDQPVSIGLPLPNYGLLIVDDRRRPVPAGETGELCVFGPGLATGYLGRPDLTAERFVANPVARGPHESRMYLTGDLARMAPGGPVYCLGRADSQVKIRGFRVELDEISSLLATQPGVAAAAVTLRKVADVDQLIGFVVPAGKAAISDREWRQALAARLPSYMVPTHFEIVDRLPRLASGKIDYRTLDGLPLRGLSAEGDPACQPRDEDEAALFAALGKLFPGRPLQTELDFFDDLGGHSLLAARLISLLRTHSPYAGLSVQTVYQERRLMDLARALGAHRLQKPSRPLRKPSPIPVSRRFFCGLAQAVFLPLFVLLHMADWLAPFFVYHYFTGDEGDSIVRAVGLSLGAFVVARFAVFGLAIAGKWAAVGRLEPGRYPLWGWVYFRWWLSGKFCELPDVFLIAGTPWMPLYLRALGARVGKNVLIDMITPAAPDLLSIEDGVSVGTFVNIENARVAAGELIVGPVVLKSDSSVDSFSVLEEHTELGERSRLGGQSALAAGRKIPAGQNWDGAPAGKSDHAPEPLPPRPPASRLKQSLLAVLFLVAAVGVSIVFFLPTFPAFMLIDWLDAHSLDVFDSGISPWVAFGFFFALSIPASALFLALTMLVTGGLRWLLPRQTAGMTPTTSLAYCHKRAVSMVLDCSLRELHGLYASVFAPLWLRFLGATVGRNAEISTAEGMVPDLLSLGHESFVADGAMLGDEELRGGWMILKPTRIGSRTFIGNGAYVSDGATVPDDVLIGVQTRAPRNEELQPGQTWIGSPPLLLPARERIGGFPESLTFRPSPARRLGRAVVEGLRVVLPLAWVIACGYLIVVLVMPLAGAYGWGFAVPGALALAGCIYGLASYVLVVALKWLVMGRYRPRAAPMWTPFVWFSEAVTNLYESLAVPNFLDLLRGTPLLPWALRLLGARIGRGVYLNTTDLTEFDCVRIGDGAELNAWCGPQTHLFEDRVMKIGRVDIGRQVTVGVRTTILYDTVVEDQVQLGPLTLVAKGERLPAGTAWEGSPAKVA